MSRIPAQNPHPDEQARITALLDHKRSLFVEAGAGSGKTSLMAGRVAMLIANGINPSEIVAITFTEAAAAELQERIESTIQKLLHGQISAELSAALSAGLSDAQKQHLERASITLDEITCTTIHGFCQQLIKPYPVETLLDPGATIIDPAAAELAFQDLMDAWLSARFGRDRGATGLGRIPPMQNAGGEDDFFAELLIQDPDGTIDLIQKTAHFLKTHRTATAPQLQITTDAFSALADSITNFLNWYGGAGVEEPTTTELAENLAALRQLALQFTQQSLTGRSLASLLSHEKPKACKKDETAFARWGRKGKFADAAKAGGQTKARGEQISTNGEVLYLACGDAYQNFCTTIGSLAFDRFVREFEPLRELYEEYKHNAALLDFDDLLHHAAELLRDHETVRLALAARYPVILVDEFQDTDPLQAEILWLLAGEADTSSPWNERRIRPGALFIVGDPKQAIYRFRGADVDTYLTAKHAFEESDPTSILEITGNFRSDPDILEYVNARFSAALDESQGQPGFTRLNPTRSKGNGPSVATIEITLGDEHKRNGRLNVDSIRAAEASVVADLVRRMIGNYSVFDKRQQKYRPARAGDIALVAPTGTSLWIYERELDQHGISLATQAGKGFFRRQEVQDLTAITRAIADPRDTVAFGAILRGPLVGLSEEQIADEIESLHATSGSPQRLNLWTDPASVQNQILRRTLEILRNLARKARQVTPFQVLAEAIEEFNIRPILRARHARGAERALANIELVLEMARAYSGRGIYDFSRALWQRWEDGDAQSEGRPDAEADAVSIITIHSAKGLEWPIVIPINSTTTLSSSNSFLYRRTDDTVHFKVFGFPSADFEGVSQDETMAIQRERVRLWYVALTRARDLLLLPKQNERLDKDWFSLVDLAIDDLPVFDGTRFTDGAIPFAETSVNRQDISTWQHQAQEIASAQTQISWHQPSRHEEQIAPTPATDIVFYGTDAVMESPLLSNDSAVIKGGPQRGVILHKLMEEVLTHEITDDLPALQQRAAALLCQLGLTDAEDTALGYSSREMADVIHRTLEIKHIAELRPKLVPEFHVYSGAVSEETVSLTAGIADAIAWEDGKIETVVDWKSDINPTASDVELYRSQVRDYLNATRAKTGLIVFLTSGRIERVHSPT